MASQINREIRDSMFRYMYSFDNYRRDLAAGLLGPVAATESITPVTLDYVFTPDVQNDLGLRVGNTFLLLVEAQSTIPTNIALRMMEYASRTVMSYISSYRELNLYGSSKIVVPAVKLFAVYTGTSTVPTRYLLKDHFTEGTDINARVEVISSKTADAPKSLTDYIRFSRKVTELVNAGVKGRDFVDTLVDYSLTENVLADLVLNHLEEVKSMMGYEERRELQRQKDQFSWQQEGRKEGRKEGLQEAVKALMETMKWTEEEAMRALKLEPNESSEVNRMSL